MASFVRFRSPNALPFAGRGKLTVPTSAQAPVASSFLRDTVILVMIPSPFHALHWAAVA
jgi:hypothetical protein